MTTLISTTVPATVAPTTRVLLTTRTATPAPAQSTTTVAAPPAAGESTKTEMSPEVSALNLELTKARRELEMKTKEGIVRARKAEGTLAAERKTWGDKLKDADAMAELRREAAVNPLSAAKKLWGEKAIDVLMQVQANGGTPSAEAVQMEFDKREKAMKAELDAKLASRDQDAAKAREAQAQQRLQLFGEQVAAAVKAGEAEFPLMLKAFGNEQAAAQSIISRIRGQWNEAKKANPQARAMNWKEAAEQLEGELYALAEYGAAHQKYAGKLKEKLTPAPASGGNAQPKVQQPSGSQLQQPSSKTLSNDLTASTQVKRAPPASEEERMQRAREAYELALKQSP